MKMLNSITYYDFENDHPYYKNLPLALLAAKNLQPTDNTTTIHMYWRVPRPFGEKQATAIKSVIVTQNPNKCHIIIWSNIDLTDNEYIQDILPYVELRIYNPVVEAIGTPVEKWPGLESTDERCYADSDIFRLIILYKYGGIYIDFDTILLRDLSPLYGVEFMAQWGNSTIHNKPWNSGIANGIIGSAAGGNLMTELLNELLIVESTIFVSYGSELIGKVRDRLKEWYVLPGAFFWPEWTKHKDISDHFKRQGIVNMYDGSFSWHWHNQWDAIPEPGSKFHILSQMTNIRFKSLTY